MNQAKLFFLIILDGFEIDGNGSSKSVSEIEYNFFLMCYAEYNQGKDSFPDQENKLYWDLMDNKEVTEEIIEKLDKELRLVQQENQNLKEDTGDIEALNEESSKVLGDIKGMVFNIKVEKILKGSLNLIPSHHLYLQ